MFGIFGTNNKKKNLRKMNSYLLVYVLDNLLRKSSTLNFPPVTNEQDPLAVIIPSSLSLEYPSAKTCTSYIISEII